MCRRAMLFALLSVVACDTKRPPKPPVDTLPSLPPLPVDTVIAPRPDSIVDSAVTPPVVVVPDTVQPRDSIPVVLPKPPEPVTRAFNFGPFHLPLAVLTDPHNGYTATVRYGVNAKTLAAQLDSIKGKGVSVGFAPTAKREAYIVKPADKTKPPYFSVELWTKDFDTVWTSSIPLLKQAIADGRIHLIYAQDEPNCWNCWYKDETQGRLVITPQQVDSVARHVKLRLGDDAPVFVRVIPSWFGTYKPKWIDGAWAQYGGRFHTPSGGQTVEQFRDKQEADAKRLGLSLVFDINYLDGGIGPCGGESAEAGTFFNDPDPTDGNCKAANGSYYRYQMSPAEVSAAQRAFMASTYACAVHGWRWTDASAVIGAVGVVRSSLQKYFAKPDYVVAAAETGPVLKTKKVHSCLRQ